jgi:predicted deacylase
LGDRVTKKQELGYITNAFGERRVPIRATIEGIVISHIQNPLVNQGDGIVHLAII